MRCHHQLLSVAGHIFTSLNTKFQIRIILGLLNTIKLLSDHNFILHGKLSLLIGSSSRLTNWISSKHILSQHLFTDWNLTRQTKLDWSNLEIWKWRDKFTMTTGSLKVSKLRAWLHIASKTSSWLPGLGLSKSAVDKLVWEWRYMEQRTGNEPENKNNWIQAGPNRQ